MSWGRKIARGKFGKIFLDDDGVWWLVDLDHLEKICRASMIDSGLQIVNFGVDVLESEPRTKKTTS